MDTDLIIRKLQQQEKPEILFSDIDGTLFSPNLNILTAPFYNIQTTLYLKGHHIPFIIVTGRSFWRRIDQNHLKILGVPKPDAVITANGTIIYYLERHGYISDFTWQGIMQSTKITYPHGESKSWNKWEIIDEITTYLRKNNFLYQLGKGNTYCIRLRLNKYPVKQIEQIRKDLLRLFPKGLRIILTEKLLWQNTLSIFSGELLITPATAGKDKAVAYLLKNFSSQIKNSIHCILFGDATVDIPMLTMKEDEKFYSLSQYAVHPTPLARKVVEENKKINNHLHILSGDGPKEILWTLRPELRPRHPEFISGSLSPAQNNKARKVIKVFEKVLDKIVDKNLSPNEVSFLGLKKLSLGLHLLHKKNSSFMDKTKGLYHYSFGNLTDVLDGIRARNRNPLRHSERSEETPGQLVDGFADRAKEFMQLFHRAKNRLSSSSEQSESRSEFSTSSNNNSIVLQTFLSAISCALPSIARAQVEISGKTVNERDEKGGSMIDRTKRLFTSLLFTTFGLEDQSIAKDVEIFNTNIATFHHRLSSLQGTKQSHYSSSESEGRTEKSKNSSRLSLFARTIKLDDMSDFQKKALERFLLYVDVLQQEDRIIKKFLSKNPKLLKEYEKESSKFAKEYLQLPVGKLRKKWGIKDYKLQVKTYL